MADCDISVVCNPDGFHDHVREPFRAGSAWLIGTNGHVLLAVRSATPAHDGHPQTVATALDLIDDTGDNWTEVPTAELALRMGDPTMDESCPACSGTGVTPVCAECADTGIVDGDICEVCCGRAHCWLCAGDGTVRRNAGAADYVVAGTHVFDRRLIALVLSQCDAPCVAWRARGETVQLRWAAGDCRGVVMRLSEQPTDDMARL